MIAKTYVALALTALVYHADGHGAIVSPRSRNSIDYRVNVNTQKCANISGEACNNGQAAFWYSQGCFIGCPACDHMSGRVQYDLCGLGKVATLNDPKYRTVNRNATAGSPDVSSARNIIVLTFSFPVLHDSFSLNLELKSAPFMYPVVIQSSHAAKSGGLLMCWVHTNRTSTSTTHGVRRVAHRSPTHVGLLEVYLFKQTLYFFTEFKNGLHVLRRHQYWLQNSCLRSVSFTLSVTLGLYAWQMDTFLHT